LTCVFICRWETDRVLVLYRILVVDESARIDNRFGRLFSPGASCLNLPLMSRYRRRLRTSVTQRDSDHCH
jgi:hypothetical protein